MARFLNVNPTYNPFTFDEMLKVPLLYDAAYKEVDKEYKEYKNKVDALEALVGNNEKALSMINQYRSDLGKAADALPNDLRSATNAAKQAAASYRKVMKLEPAITNLQAAQKVRASKDNGTLIGNPLTLDNFIDNPLYEDKFVLGSNIQEEAMKAVAAASARRQSGPQVGSALGGAYYGITNNIGYSPQEFRDWMNNPDKYPELTEIATQLMNKYGNFDKNQVAQYVTRGMYDGIAYKTETDYKENPYTKANIAFNTWKKQKEYEAGIAGQTNGASGEYVREGATGTTIPAVFGRKDIKNKKGNLVIQQDNGSYTIKDNKDLFTAFGIPNRVTKIHLGSPSTRSKELLTDKQKVNLMFTDDGKLRTPEDFQKQLQKLDDRQSKEFKQAIKFYSQAYKQLQDTGYDVNKSFINEAQNIVNEHSKQISAMPYGYKGNAVPNKSTYLEAFKNYANGLYNSSEEFKHMSDIYAMSFSVDKESMSRFVRQTTDNNGHIYEYKGVNRENDGTVSPKLGNAKEYSEELKKAIENNTQLFAVPQLGGYIFSYDGKEFFIKSEDYNRADLSEVFNKKKHIDDKLEALQQSYEYAEGIYKESPTAANRKYLEDIIKLINYYNSNAAFEAEQDALYAHVLKSPAFNKLSSSNANTTTLQGTITNLIN